MNSETITVTLQESWASAFVDGEVPLADCVSGLNDTVHEQLYYYTVTRQVLRGEISAGCDARFATQRATWVQFWTRVDQT